MTNLRQAIEAFPWNVEELLKGTKYCLEYGEQDAMEDGEENAALVQLQAQMIDELVGALEQSVPFVDVGCVRDYAGKALELAEMLKGRVG